MPTESCLEELETLSAIFMDDIKIIENLPDGGSRVSMVLYPATADDHESQYVTLTLEIVLSDKYPSVIPQINFRNPRGLNDAMLNDLMSRMKTRCEECIDCQMIYELIDMGKEFLTKNNRPASECPICLLMFTEFDVFHKTKCFHHFHSYCLGKYMQYLILNAKDSDDTNGDPEVKYICPVCRENLDYVDVDKLTTSPPPSEEVDSGCTLVLQDWYKKQAKMKPIFEKQKSQGGIIDLNESKKLIIISGTPSTTAEAIINDDRIQPTGAAGSQRLSGDIETLEGDGSPANPVRSNANTRNSATGKTPQNGITKSRHGSSNRKGCGAMGKNRSK